MNRTRPLLLWVAGMAPVSYWALSSGAQAVARYNPEVLFGQLLAILGSAWLLFPLFQRAGQLRLGALILMSVLGFALTLQFAVITVERHKGADFIVPWSAAALAVAVGHFVLITLLDRHAAVVASRAGKALALACGGALGLLAAWLMASDIIRGQMEAAATAEQAKADLLLAESLISSDPERAFALIAGAVRPQPYGPDPAIVALAKRRGRAGDTAGKILVLRACGPECRVKHASHLRSVGAYIREWPLKNSYAQSETLYAGLPMAIRQRCTLFDAALSVDMARDVKREGWLAALRELEPKLAAAREHLYSGSATPAQRWLRERIPRLRNHPLILRRAGCSALLDLAQSESELEHLLRHLSVEAPDDPQPRPSDLSPEDLLDPFLVATFDLITSK